jgi:hypothetical protein
LAWQWRRLASISNTTAVTIPIRNHTWINRLAAMTMDLIGASSYVWHWKHVVVHHTYVNITGHDADIDIAFFGA